MSQIIFNYKGNNYLIQCQIKEKMTSVIEGFYNKSLVTRGSVYFLCKGDLLNIEITEDKIPPNEQNQKIVLVYDINDQNNDTIVKSNEIICKTCKENSKIAVDNYHIILFGCKNGHKIDNIKFNEFAQTQYINLSKIICDVCKERNKGNSYKKQFYRCLTCKGNICLMCKENHSSEHYLINYDQKNYICDKHGEFYHSYCYSCNINLCTSCESLHRQHATESFGSMIKDKDTLFAENEKLRNNIEQINKIISDIIEKLNKVKENLGIYYEIHKSIVTNNNKFRNYEILFNINEICNNTINKDLENIIKEKNNLNQINNIMNIYNKMETSYKMESESDSEFSILNQEANVNIININNNDNPNNPPQQDNNLSKSVEKINKQEEKPNEFEMKKQRSAIINLVNEMKNVFLEDVINKKPLVSELLDINELVKSCKEDSPERNIIKLITDKYKNYREVRQNGNSFYTCFIYRLFEYISLHREQNLYKQIGNKIIESKNLIINNQIDWDILKDSYTMFLNEFNTCFEQSLISLKACRRYLDELFKSDERYNYLNLFIHFVIAAYLKENRILYEYYVDEDYEKFIQKVEEVGSECSQIEVLACSNFFDIGIKIEYLYPTKVDVVKYPESKKGDEIFINILFRPDHYDILYKLNEN